MQTRDWGWYWWLDLLIHVWLLTCDIWWMAVMQNAVERPPKYFGSWVGAYTINVFIVVWVLIVGFGFGGWASMTNFILQIDTFGFFTKCYQCPSTARLFSPGWPLPMHVETPINTLSSPRALCWIRGLIFFKIGSAQIKGKFHRPATPGQLKRGRKLFFFVFKRGVLFF